MGRAAQILLVARRFIIASLLLTSINADATTVNAARYNAFWLWAAVQPQPVLHQADTLYLHQGEIALRRGDVVFLRQGLPASTLTVKHLWLSFRVTTLDFGEPQLARILNIAQRWRALGNRVEGIQIDFDAASYHLSGYVAFLQQLRQRLPSDYRLSVTGLLDWAKTGEISQINRLNDIVDELVVQTYQGRNTVNRYTEYLPALLTLRVPFRLGLVQHGRWDERWQHRLSASPFYRGAVVFLLNPPPAKRSTLTR
ncbi:hypothetical protein AU509_14550 [Lonsdalea britannica]|uniref:DUF3142 domain-containing protein n=1 Tax=Lonsdalea britannica TaxID=1082704 RepID=A0AAD0WK05_9GAMM|nr:DUF3142 domain-containing protein [Lonsdalea britannica]AXW86316.1 DUF3142 domain-containing protein [Lonsdalea britannica]OSM94961.1 hypothetical protein AU509_14550 [Lonsdalea britannica]